MNTDTFMCSSDEKQTRSPLSLYSEYQRMEIEFRARRISCPPATGMVRSK